VAERLPVALVSGFLGSGRTTLVRRLLTHRELGETAVIVNELGEEAIDHHLLRRVDERTVLLANGCVCCSLRADLAEELVDLLDRRAAGEIPRFRRVVVETTGLADPAPILQTLVADPVVRNQYELETLITTVDAVHGTAQLEREEESLRQAVVADRLVLTKVDIASPAGAAHLEERLRALNPVAPVLRAVHGAVAPTALLGRRQRERRSLPEVAHTHGGGVQAFSLSFDRPLDWTGFGVWLTMLLQSRGQDVLRVKGLLDVGLPGPVLLNAVQHVVHPPEHLDAWPDGVRRSRLVLIGRGLDPAAVEASLAAFAGPTARRAA
jgi:G3E family GTPase